MKVLLPIDGSPHSEAAVAEVAGREWPAGSEVEVLTIVHARTPLLPDPAFALAAVYVETMREQHEHAPELVNPVADRIRQGTPRVSVTTKVLEGDPKDMIVREARDWGADLIVLGSHGRSPAKQALLGSVASGVAAGAACAVEIVKAARQRVTVHAA